MIAWNDVTKSILRELYYEKGLSDEEIAKIYGVTKNKVRYKREKFGITFKMKVLEECMRENKEMFDKLNSDSKARLLNNENIDGIAKALTHYAFRNGPVEDMHSDGKLTDEDMKILNKYMVNRLAGIMVKINEERWLELELLYSYLKLYGISWDKAEPDCDEIDFIWETKMGDIILGGN